MRENVNGPPGRSSNISFAGKENGRAFPKTLCMWGYRLVQASSDSQISAKSVASCGNDGASSLTDAI